MKHPIFEKIEHDVFRALFDVVACEEICLLEAERADNQIVVIYLHPLLASFFHGFLNRLFLESYFFDYKFFKPLH